MIMDEFKTLVDVCEESIRMVEKYWHNEMAPTLEGEKYAETKMWMKDALIGLRSNVMLLETNLKRLEDER